MWQFKLLAFECLIYGACERKDRRKGWMEEIDAKGGEMKYAAPDLV